MLSLWAGVAAAHDLAPPPPTPITITHLSGSGGITHGEVLTARPGAELGAPYYRRWADLSGMSKFRLSANITSAGFSNSLLVRYTTNADCVTGIADLGTDTAAELPLGTTTGVKSGAYGAIASGARTSVCLVIYQFGATATTTMGYRSILMDVQ